MSQPGQGKKRKRELRANTIAELKELTKKVRSVERNDDPHEVQEVLKVHMTRSNDLYQNVKKKLDGTAADSRHMRELLSLGHESSKRINVTRKSFDLRETLIALMRDSSDASGRKISTKAFSRQIVEKHVNTFIKIPPTFEFFYGTFSSEDLQTRPKEKNKRIQIVVPKAVTAKEKDLVNDVEQDSTPKEVEHINQQVSKLALNKSDGVPFFETIVDPESFTQTVENIFHISFLIKEGKVGVKSKPGNKVMLTVEKASTRTQEEEQEARQAKAKQSILSFSMADYEEWISQYNISERAFQPRNDS